LHALLQQAGVQGPIVLMGHSRAGLYIRAYNHLHPEQVKGLIFVDAGSPLNDDRMSPELRAASSYSAASYSKPLYYSLVSLMALGLHRVMGACSPDPRFDEPTGKRIAQLECGKNFSPIWQELVASQQSGEETINTGPYGDLPVLIFSHDTQLDRQSSKLPPKLALEESVFWDQEQENLKRLSTRSRRIIAKGSGHPIQYDRADLINREVAIFVQQIRNNEARTDYGSTKTE
jgi:pimeloyl-ACP methyl ester carboxylesterase